VVTRFAANAAFSSFHAGTFEWHSLASSLAVSVALSTSSVHASDQTCGCTHLMKLQCGGGEVM
jgi:hypothetical protein